MHFMVIEHFRGGDPLPVYRRLREIGRALPANVHYVSSWVTSDLQRCYQIMECSNREDLDRWLDAWSDLTEFEVRRVITSQEAQAEVAPHL